MSEQVKVDFAGPLGDSHGMAIQCRRLAFLLDEVADVRTMGFNPKNVNHRLSAKEITRLMGMTNKEPRVPDIMVHYVLPSMYQPRADCYNVGVLSWETSKLPSRPVNLGNGVPAEANNWAQRIQDMDEIWTFCKNSAEAIKKSGYKKPVTVIPGPIDTDFWNPDEERADLNIMGVTVDKRGNKITDKFVVGYVADWNERKDIETFIAVTSLALPPQDSVIVLKTKDYIGNQNVAEAAAAVKQRLVIQNLPPIVVVDKDLSPDEMHALINSFDVYACTSRGEGLNMPLLEAMAMKKQVVAPAHSAHLDYLEQGKNGNLIGVNLEICRTQVKNPWYQNDQVWGKINEVQYLQCLQALHKGWRAGQLKSNEAGRKTVENNYSIGKCQTVVKQRLEAFRDGLVNLRRTEDESFTTVSEVDSVPLGLGPD